jgi:integrase
MLTTKEIDTAKPGKKPYRLFDGLGLYIEIAPNGGKYWRLKYNFLGKEKRLAIGKYPEISLLEAREKRDQARKLLTSNIDPSNEKKRQKRDAILNAAITFELVAREWHEHTKERWSASYVTDTMHRLERDIFPKIGNRPIGDISTPELLLVMRAIEKRGAYEVARRMLQICNQIFRYGVVTGRTRYNPAPDLRGALKPIKREHFAAIEIKEIPDFLQALERNEARLYAQTRHAIKFLMLTFVRTGELIAAKWDEFNFEEAEWIIPAERMKMRKAHIVPLAKQSLVILQEMKKLNGKREWVFASQAQPRQHMSNNTILHALGRLGYQGRMTGHGFRALAMSTIKEKIGYRHEVVDRQLAHAPANKVDAAYDRARFLDERRKMMQEWADYLDRVATQAKVVHVDFKAAE